VLAVRLHDDGLKVDEIETPSPDPGEVLVRVHAAAITRNELEWPVDRLPAIPSYELSGVVVGSYACRRSFPPQGPRCRSPPDRRR
jgi:NADPH:quinone reductase-like Zn-dependent oxidoreductase